MESCLRVFLLVPIIIGTILFGNFSALANGLQQNSVCTSLLDVIFLLDESGSISSSNFSKVKSFVRDMVQTLPVNDTEVHVSVIQFGSRARTIWDFNAPEAREKNRTLSAIDRIYQTTGSTNTAQGLDYVANVLTSGGARSSTPRLVIVMTDGVSNNRSQTYAAADRLFRHNVTVFVMGVGNSVDQNECKYIAGCGNSSSCNQFIRADWNNLLTQVNSMLKVVCQTLPQDAVCSAWSDYGPCKGGCGTTGVQESTRVELESQKPGTPTCPTCTAPNGRSCLENGGLVRTRSCPLPPCPVDSNCGEFGQWSPWSSTCGRATRSRQRVGYERPPASNGGKTCLQQQPPKHEVETENAEFKPCPVTQVPGPWGPWSVCSKQCGGGTQERTRSGIPQENELHGGERLEEQGIPVREERACNTEPCPVNATCGDYSDWGACSKPCGGGTRSRSRDPWKRDQMYGGKTCEEQHPEGRVQTELCNTSPCPVNEVPGEWAEWGECSANCGEGTRSRDRLASPVHAQHGGKTLEEQNLTLPEKERIYREETETCMHHPCGPCTLPWSEWSKCDVECGSGHRWRDTIVAFYKRNVGCELPTHEVEPCEGPCIPEGEREEGSGVNAAAIAGGIVGGLVLVAAAGGGAAYYQHGQSGGEAEMSQNEFDDDAAEAEIEEVEKEALVAPSEQDEMWE